MAGWNRPIITDSGGFQIYSLIHQNAKLGSLSDKGALFRVEGTGRKYKLTPEKSVQLQLSYGADVVICLDDCTHIDDSQQVQQESVERTVNWARRSKSEFVRLVESGEHRPLLFAVIQGGGDKALRKQCAHELLEIGFDGYGYGGWPLDSDSKLLEEMFAYLRELIPPEFPMHALGVGHPRNIVRCTEIGYQIFDSAMPTRDARHGRLYTFKTENPSITGDWFSYLYINDEKHVKSTQPLLGSPYSMGYLHHLFKIGDVLYTRLATMHNLAFMSHVIGQLRRTHG